jgi:hypothetical protein
VDPGGAVIQLELGRPRFDVLQLKVGDAAYVKAKRLRVFTSA